MDATCAQMTQLIGMVQVKEGDTVLYFKYAGETMETPEGQQFIVVHEQDILCKC